MIGRKNSGRDSMQLQWVKLWRSIRETERGSRNRERKREQRRWTMPNPVVKVRWNTIAACMTCPLCNKLFKEATTISECLHTCKHLRSPSNLVHFSQSLVKFPKFWVSCEFLRSVIAFSIWVLPLLTIHPDGLKGGGRCIWSLRNQRDSMVFFVIWCFWKKILFFFFHFFSSLSLSMNLWRTWMLVRTQKHYGSDWPTIQELSYVVLCTWAVFINVLSEKVFELLTTITTVHSFFHQASINPSLSMQT